MRGQGYRVSQDYLDYRDFLGCRDYRDRGLQLFH
jgi:hypothetical protein